MGMRACVCRKLGAIFNTFVMCLITLITTGLSAKLAKQQNCFD